MSSKTRIVVLHRKELIYTALFAILGILLLCLLAAIFWPSKANPGSNAPSRKASADIAASAVYIPGVYTTELVLGSESVNVEVIVDSTRISSVKLLDLNDAVTTMYPLLRPTFDSICEQVMKHQSLDLVTYSTENKYTSLVLLESIRRSVEKALVTSADGSIAGS